MGGAGATAAITAHDSGADVLILEKMPEPGGSTLVSVGGWTMPEDAADYARYLETICFKTVDTDMIDVLVQGSLENTEWIRSLGGDVQPFTYPQVSYSLHSPDISFPGVPGGEKLARYTIKGTDGWGGYRMWQLLSENVKQRGIRVLTSTPAKELVQNEKGEIVGALAETDGKIVTIKAKRGVILTCGGFENDKELTWDNLPCKPICFLGNPGNTGDGIRMAQKVGAALWHMGRLSSTLGFKAPELEAAFYINFLAPGFIYVDHDAQRFANETGVDSHEYWKVLSYFDTRRFIYPRIPCYVILDEEVIRRGPLVQRTSGYNLLKYKWSLDNSVEVKKGWVKKAKSIPDLAKQLSLDASALEETITSYNNACLGARDDAYGRSKDSMEAINSPYYAMQLWPAMQYTQGGPRRNKEARVLDPYGKPIPRLYSAGELGSMWGFLYQNATMVPETLVFGRIAGRNAAAQPPLES
ncbi:FAD-binding protein [Chloroflexota bacterium]